MEWDADMLQILVFVPVGLAKIEIPCLFFATVNSKTHRCSRIHAERICNCGRSTSSHHFPKCPNLYKLHSVETKMSLTSNQLNYLIWRYLQESGLELTPFALQKETEIEETEKSLGTAIAKGALVSLVQKGIQYMQVERNVSKSMDGTQGLLMNSSFNVLDALVEPPLSPAQEMDVEEPQIQTHKKHQGQELSAPVQPQKDASIGSAQSTQPVGFADLVVLERFGSIEESQFSPNEANKLAASGTNSLLFVDVPENVKEGLNGTEKASGTEAMSVDETKCKITTLPLLSPREASAEFPSQICSLQWSPTGKSLAAAAVDGIVYTWTSSGKLKQTLVMHRAPVLALQWNPTEEYLLSIDCTNTVVIWDCETGNILQTCDAVSTEASGSPQLNQPPISNGTAADWIDKSTFVVTAANAAILAFRVEEKVPLLRFRGHVQGINALKFDSSTMLLASASDDHIVRIWHGKSPGSIMTLVGHSGPVMALCWAPIGTSLASSIDPVSYGRSLLISASTDGTIRIWDLGKGVCLSVLAIHEGAIFCCEISPNGKYLASGGEDGVVVIWDIRQVRLDSQQSGADRAAAKYEPPMDKGAQVVNSITWNADGSKLFVGYSSESVLLDTGFLLK